MMYGEAMDRNEVKLISATMLLYIPAQNLI
jgi:hypothetical protein